MPETQRMNPVGALFSSTWRIYKERFAVLTKIVLIPALFLALGGIISSRIVSFPLTLIGSLFTITGSVLTIFASIAIIISLEHKTNFDESWGKSTMFFWSYIWVSILTTLAAFGAFVMLIVPGIILSVALVFTRFALVLENRRGLDALTQSRAYARGYWWALLGRYILLGLCMVAFVAVICIPAALLFGPTIASLVYAALLLFITPFTLIYLFEVYKNLVALKPEVHGSHGAATSGGKKFLTVSAIVGVVAPIVLIIGFIVLLLKFPATNMRCEGFMQNAPVCPSGYHCQLNSRMPDTGGICVPD